MNEELKIIISAEIGKLQQELHKARNEVDRFRQRTGVADTSLGRMQAATQRAGTELTRLKHNTSSMAESQNEASRSIDNTSKKAEGLGRELDKTGGAAKDASHSFTTFEEDLIDVIDACYNARNAAKDAGAGYEALRHEMAGGRATAEWYKEAIGNAIMENDTKAVEELKEEYKHFRLEVQDAADALAKIEKEIDEVTKSSKTAKEKFKDFGETVKQVGEKSRAVLKVVAGAVAGIVTALVASSAATKEFRQNQAKLVTSFEIAGASADAAKEVYKDLYRVLGDDGQATEAAQHLAKITTNQKELELWTKITQGVYAQFGDSLPIESLAEAANETAKTGELTGALTDALVWAGVSEDDFAAKLLECNNEAEREALIRETLIGLYGAAAEKYEENAASVLAQNEAELRLKDTMAQLGEAMVPVLTAFAEMAATIAEQVAPAIQNFMDNHGEELTNVLLDIADAIGEVITWIVDNWEIFSALTIAIISISTALSVLSTYVAVVNAVMAASPVPWIVLAIVAAIALLVAIIVVIIKHWDDIKGAGKKAWEGIQNAWNNAASWFNQKIVQPIKNFFSGMWDGLKSGASKAWEGIKSVFSVVTDWFKNVFTKAWQGVKNVFSTGGKIFSGIKDGIVSVFKTVVNGIITGINTVITLPFKGLNTVLDKIEGIKIAGIKPFDWLNWRIPIPQIPKLARGGIVDGATLAMIGEQGKEAVMPLENNTEWIDKLAGKISAAQGGNRPIYLVCDKRIIGQIAAEGINGITKQTGNIPLVLA